MAKQTNQLDWHQADVVAAIHKSGMSLQRLSRLSGYSSNTLNQAFVKPYPKCERIIAAHLKISPQSIWPSRYNADGTPKSGYGQRGLGRHKCNLVANKKPPVCNNVFIQEAEITGNVNNTLPIKQALAA